jgi:hypothetical protein
MGDAANPSSRTDFLVQVSRLVRSAGHRLLMKRSLAGLFFGLLAAAVSAFLAGTVALPVPGALLAAALTAAGAAAGALSALLSSQDPMRLLIQADAALGSRELASTAFELAAAPQGSSGLFAGAVMEDASRLLARTDPRLILGKLRMPLLPFIPIAALLAVGALLFPVDLRSLFMPPITDSQMGRIGEDLRESGERLAESAQAQGLGRSIELSRQLAQLGSDIEARKVAPKEALDRMGDIQSGLQQEYELRRQEAQPAPSGAPQAGQGKPGEGPSAGTGKDKATKDLADALKQLQEAQREMGGQGAEGGSGADKGQGTPNDQAPGSGQDGQTGKGPGFPGQGQGGKGKAPGGPGTDSGSGNAPEETGQSGIGTLPAPQKRGPATPINPGDKGPGLQAQGNAASDESTRMLVRTLPEWTGSRLPEETVLKQYSRQAESALARDEVPLKLRQSVKEYFTIIGITK